MPQNFAVGEAVKVTRAKKWREERARAEDLWQWGVHHRTQTRESVWRRSERQYVGRHFEEVDGSALDSEWDKIKVNMSFSTINTIVPYTTGNEPSFWVEPYMAPATKGTAILLKAWLNRLWRSDDSEGQEHLETAQTDSLIYGDGFMEVLWDTYEDMESTDGEFGLGEAKEYVRIWVTRTSPWDVWMDPYSNGLQDARWVAIRKWVPLQVIQADDRYRNTDDLRVSDSTMTPQSNTDKPEDANSYFMSDTERDGLVELIEFYDTVEKTLLCFVPGAEYPLRSVQGISPPLYQLKNYRIPRSPYGMGELEQLWSLQSELNKTRSQMITHRRRNVGKYLAREGALSQTAQDALRSQEIGEIIYVQGNQSFDDIVKPLEMAQMSADPYQVSDLVTRDIYEISGVNEYLRGATPSVSRTATEASIIESASNIKSTHKLRQVEKFLRKVGQRILDTAAVTYPQTEMDEFGMVIQGREAQALAKEAGDPDPQAAEEGTLMLTEDTFRGVYQVFVETGSTEMRNPRFRAEQYKDVLNTVAPLVPLLMQTQQRVPDLSMIVELYLEAIGIENVDSIMGNQPPPPPMSQPPSPDQGGENTQGTQPGGPMLSNAQAPAAPLDAQNTGALPIGM
jgi:hypothetical protein